MSKREFRIVECIGPVPFLAVCAACSLQFKIVGSGVHTVLSAEANLRQQFDDHKCVPMDSSQNAVRIVREATEDK